MTHLYLIRHGEAVVNVEPVVGGMRGDTGLTPRGVAQAEQLRDRLQATREIAADVLIASTLLRARQTAEIIAPALDLPIQWEDEVQEMRVGEADGLTLQEMWDQFGVPDLYNNPLTPIAPGGENWGQFMLRVGTAIERITRMYEGKTIVIVCHGGVIDGSFVYFFGFNTMSLPPIEFRTHNTSLTHWARHVHNGRARWQLMGYNDIAHLQDIGVRESIRWEDVTPNPAEHPGVPLPTEEQGEDD